LVFDLEVRVAMSGAASTYACPQCGHGVPITAPTADETGEQLALDQTDCSNCGATLLRDVDGHADRGWRLRDEA